MKYLIIKIYDQFHIFNLYPLRSIWYTIAELLDGDGTAMDKDENEIADMDDD